MIPRHEFETLAKQHQPYGPFVSNGIKMVAVCEYGDGAIVVANQFA
ncbi:MAG: hypothetical protein GXP16_02240 [Gammaproteobacteria bacterium]|nr:hypothetical protein [Gammaproteobacteria bacterium]